MKILTLGIIILFAGVLYSQESKYSFSEIATWTLVQAIPSPTFYQDNSISGQRFIAGLRWNITPFNYSFNANKLVSPLQFFKVNPVRRYGGSVELFIQPEWLLTSFKYAELNRFTLTQGVKLYFPLAEYGEYLAGSVGVKYSIRKSSANNSNNTFGLEMGTYTFFGILGFTFTYNFSEISRYNFSINLKYY